MSNPQEIENLRREVSNLRTEVSTLRESVEDLVTAWKSANFILSAVKWVATVGAGIAGIVLFLKTGK